MSTATLAPIHFVRFKRATPRTAPGLRLEGSLAGVASLAPVVPIFPELAFTPKAKSENSKTKI